MFFICANNQFITLRILYKFSPKLVRINCLWMSFSWVPYGFDCDMVDQSAKFGIVASYVGCTKWIQRGCHCEFLRHLFVMQPILTICEINSTIFTVLLILYLKQIAKKAKLKSLLKICHFRVIFVLVLIKSNFHV